jgi:hypothetical protein
VCLFIIQFNLNWILLKFIFIKLDTFQVFNSYMLTVPIPCCKDLEHFYHPVMVQWWNRKFYFFHFQNTSDDRCSKTWKYVSMFVFCFHTIKLNHNLRRREILHSEKSTSRYTFIKHSFNQTSQYIKMIYLNWFKQYCLPLVFWDGKNITIVLQHFHTNTLIWTSETLQSTVNTNSTCGVFLENR